MGEIGKVILKHMMEVWHPAREFRRMAKGVSPDVPYSGDEIMAGHLFEEMDYHRLWGFKARGFYEVVQEAVMADIKPASDILVKHPVGKVFLEFLSRRQRFPRRREFAIERLRIDRRLLLEFGFIPSEPVLGMDGFSIKYITDPLAALETSLQMISVELRAETDAWPPPLPVVENWITGGQTPELRACPGEVAEQCRILHQELTPGRKERDE